MSLARRLAERAAGGGIAPRDGGMLTAWRFTRDGVVAEEIVEIEPVEGASVRRTAAPEMPGEAVVPPGTPVADGAAVPPEAAAQAPRVAPPAEAVSAAQRFAKPGADMARPAAPPAPSADGIADAAAPESAPVSHGFSEPPGRHEVHLAAGLPEAPDAPPPPLAGPAAFQAGTFDRETPGEAADVPVAESVAGTFAREVHVVPAVPAPDAPSAADPGRVEALPPVFAFEEMRPHVATPSRQDARPRVVVERVDVLVEAPPPPPAHAQQAAERARAGARYLTGL